MPGKHHGIKQRWIQGKVGVETNDRKKVSAEAIQLGIKLGKSSGKTCI